MAEALIGYTGFVGGNIAAQHNFSHRYNTQNSSDIENQAFDLVVCAGVRADKWRINNEPDIDLKDIKALVSKLETIRAKHFILISTVDVYMHPRQVNEDSPIVTEGLHAYGRNRYYLEQFCASNFDTTIVRLPGLFGNGLKKNVIFDLWHGNRVEKINPDGLIQYYDLARIWSDIETARANGIKLINFATPPIQTATLARECFGIIELPNEDNAPAANYDFWTKYAAAYGNNGNYLATKSSVLAGIKALIGKEGI